FDNIQSFNHSTLDKFSPLSLHDALPICPNWPRAMAAPVSGAFAGLARAASEGSFEVDVASARSSFSLSVAGATGSIQGGSAGEGDRKSTRLNSSHQIISYAVFCLIIITT